ncbi:MAG: hypothetical protein ACREDK_03710 [Thermoplasmata archaeon]
MKLVVAIGAALLVALVVPAVAPSASAAPVLPAGGAPQQWAYGAENWANHSVTVPNGTYTSHAFYGWQVIFTATNTSPTTVMLEAERTMGAYLYTQFCSPSCASPMIFGNLSLVAHEHDAGFANLTYNATVYENGTASAAIGIVDASSQGASSLNESFVFRATHGNLTRSTAYALRVTGHSQASVAFGPSLGLVPWNAQRGLSWNSSAPFTAQGGWAINWSAQRTGYLGGTLNLSGNPSGAVHGNGTVALFGHDWGNVTLRNGLTVPAISLTLVGPFDDHEGVILVPHDFDMFGGNHMAYESESLGMQSAATAKVDFALDALHHRVHIAASATDFASSDSSLGPMIGASTGAQPAATGTSPTEVQGQPEGVAQAQQASNCLNRGCPSSPAAGGIVHGAVLGVLVVGLIAIAIIGTVAVVEYRAWAARRLAKGLPGSYGQVPTSGLPPPGAALGTSPGNPPTPGSGPSSPTLPPR